MIAIEPKKTGERKSALVYVIMFLVFCIVAMASGLISESKMLGPDPLGPGAFRKPQHSKSKFEGIWFLEGRDEDIPGKFEALYSYRGPLELKTDDYGALSISGSIETRSLDGATLQGTGKLLGQGQIDDGQFTATYTYSNETTFGLGTAFIDFDHSGGAIGYLVFRVTKEGHGRVARAIVQLTRK